MTLSYTLKIVLSICKAAADLAQFMKIVALIDAFWINVVTLPGK